MYIILGIFLYSLNVVTFLVDLGNKTYCVYFPIVTYVLRWGSIFVLDEQKVLPVRALTSASGNKVVFQQD